MLFCTNPGCEYIDVNAKTGDNMLNELCPFCGHPLALLDVVDLPPIGNLTPVRRELHNKALKLFKKDPVDTDRWVDTSRWPGPIAYELHHLKSIMLDGNIEGSCWKLVNLAEIITYYLFAAVMEKKKASIEELRQPFCDQSRRTPLQDLSSTRMYVENNLSLFDDRGDFTWNIIRLLRRIATWRNREGVGHGSLSRDKLALVDVIHAYSVELWQQLLGFSDFLKENGLSLYRQRDWISLTGHDYLSRVDEAGPVGIAWNDRISICKNANLSPVRPIIVYGYHLDPADLYFLVGYYRDHLLYRNFRANRQLYFTAEYNVGRRYNDVKTIISVPLRYGREREQWLQFLEDEQTSFTSETKTEINAFLLAAGKRLYKVGLYIEAKELLDTNKNLFVALRDTNEQVEQDILGSLIKIAMRQININQKFVNRFVDFVQNQTTWNNGQKLFTLVELLWQCGDRKKPDWKIAEYVINKIRELWNSINIHERDLSGKIMMLEAAKNYLFANRYTESQDKQRLKKFKGKCEKMFAETLPIYLENPDNEVITDLMGFFCNLYCDFSQRLLQGQENSAEETVKMEGFIRFGEKVRGHMFGLWPDDVWTARGYAWSVHRHGRFYRDIEKDYKQAQEKIEQAQRIRSHYIVNVGGNHGLESDIAKGRRELEELARLR